jgi:hypothetical protein
MQENKKEEIRLKSRGEFLLPQETSPRKNNGGKNRNKEIKEIEK